MNCKEFNKWLRTVPENKIFSLDEKLQSHFDSCIDCQNKVNVLRGAVNYMNQQKSYDLSDRDTSHLIEILVQGSQNNFKLRQHSIISFSRIVAAAVIIIGLLAGSLAGTLLSKRNTSGANGWNTEFAALSDNSELISYVFD